LTSTKWLTEFELKELPGYEGSSPVKIGNAASEQFQLDVYGEVAVAFLGTVMGKIEKRLWSRWRTVVDYVETHLAGAGRRHLGDQGQFLACSFWLVSGLALNQRVEEARALFERLVGLCNDLGLLAEEYDVKRQRQVGNFPQAFSRLTLIGAATAISAEETKDSP
jgi:GH15 family glucan-1,4-alpha-glucosidase